MTSTEIADLIKTKVDGNDQKGRPLGGPKARPEGA
jgi:hypothetical protein